MAEKAYQLAKDVLEKSGWKNFEDDFTRIDIRPTTLRSGSPGLRMDAATTTHADRVVPIIKQARTLCCSMSVDFSFRRNTTTFVRIESYSIPIDKLDAAIQLAAVIREK